MHAVWTCIIIYGTEEPVPPWQAPLPITKWSGGGWDLERKCQWKAIFLYVADFWFLPCPPVHAFSIQNEHMRSEWKEKICGEQLSSPPLPLMPACLPVPGSSGVWVWERFPSFPGLCLAPVSTAWVWVFEHTFIEWGFTFILTSRLATRAAEVSGDIVDTSGLSQCPEEGAVVSFSSSPPSFLICGCMLNCFGSHPWSRALVQVPGDCCGEAPQGVAYRAWMEAKGCTETAFCFSAVASAWLLPSLIYPSATNNLLTLLSPFAQFILHTAARATFVKCKNVITWLQSFQRLPDRHL